jgi:hypothetical protein
LAGERARAVLVLGFGGGGGVWAPKWAGWVVLVFFLIPKFIFKEL